jgi:hypothetical protein
MRTLAICDAIAVGVTVILATGCGAGGNALPVAASSASTAPSVARIAARDRVFDAAYSGQFACKPDGSIGHIGVWAVFHGRGKASFLHGSQEQIVYPNCGSYGTFTLWRSPYKDSIHGDLVGAECSTDTYTVTGGTGKFAKAAGIGTVTFTCLGRNYSAYTDRWSGKIGF